MEVTDTQTRPGFNVRKELRGERCPQMSLWETVQLTTDVMGTGQTHSVGPSEKGPSTGQAAGVPSTPDSTYISFAQL